MSKEANAGWLRDGGLLYRLTDGRCPENRDEINITMVDGSRDLEIRGRAAHFLQMKLVREFQYRVQPWMLACFGEVIAADREERNHRFLEEALELVQACGCSASEAHQLVDYVYGRPVGELAQEVGGVMVTLAALCLANSLDMHDAGEVELARIWTKVEAIRAKQAAKPKHSPLPASVSETPVELPDPAFKLRWSGAQGRYTVSEPNIGDTDCYTPAQMSTALAWKQRAQVAELMAECTSMLRSDLIQAGVIDETVPPMMLTEAILGALQKARSAKAESPAQFPGRIWSLLQDVAERNPPVGTGTYEDGMGEPLQDDADAAIAWIKAAAPVVPAPVASMQVFTTPDADLNELLLETYLLGKSDSLSHDEGMLWLEALESVLTKINAQAAPVAQLSEPVWCEAFDESMLEDMARAEYEAAMSFGVSLDSFMRLARSVHKRTSIAATTTPKE